MKVLFLRNDIGSLNIQRKKIMKNFGLYPPIALCQMAAIAREAGHEVHLIDAMAYKTDFDHTIQMVIDYSPDLIAFSLWTTTFHVDMELAKELKKKLPHSKQVIGGPHLDLYATETMTANPFVDYAVHGEGEQTFVELLAFLSNEFSIEEIKGLLYRDSGNIVKNPSRDKVENLDDIPFPAIDLLPLGKYHSIMAKNNKPIYVLTTRGCPYKCVYCVDQQFGRSVRLHSPEYVIKYIKWLVNDLGINEIHYYDDTFTLNKKRTLEICKKIQEEKLNIPWTIRTRVDNLNQEIVEALWNAGCYRIGFGVESGNQEIMDLMKRGITLEQVRKAFVLTREYPFEIIANFMIGYLDESKSTYKNTIDFAIELDPDFAYFSITQVEPCSDLFNQASKLNLVNPDEWHDYVLGKIDMVNLNNYFLPGKDYSIDDLDKMLSLAYIKFYLRPSKVWQQFKKVKDIKMFLRKFKMSMGMIGFYLETLLARIRIHSSRTNV